MLFVRQTSYRLGIIPKLLLSYPPQSSCRHSSFKFSLVYDAMMMTTIKLEKDKSLISLLSYTRAGLSYLERNINLTVHYSITLCFSVTVSTHRFCLKDNWLYMIRHSSVKVYVFSTFITYSRYFSSFW